MFSQLHRGCHAMLLNDVQCVHKATQKQKTSVSWELRPVETTMTPLPLHMTLWRIMGQWAIILACGAQYKWKVWFYWKATVWANRDTFPPVVIQVALDPMVMELEGGWDSVPPNPHSLQQQPPPLAAAATLELLTNLAPKPTCLSQHPAHKQRL